MNIGDRGCQCPKCHSANVEYQSDDELNDWYSCRTCESIDMQTTGDKYDFTCTVLPTRTKEDQEVFDRQTRVFRAMAHARRFNYN